MHINRFKKVLLASFLITTSSLNPLKASWFAKKNNKAKVLRTYITAKVENIDPADMTCVYKSKIVSQVYEPMLTYDYTAAGPELIPLLLEKMPEVSKDGLVYTFTLKRGIHFHNNPCFKATQGKGPELTAKDVVYSLVRLFDPAIKCKNYTSIEGIKGAKTFREARNKNPNTPYIIEGIQEINKYSVQITLDTPNPELLYYLAMPFTATISKQAVNYYKKEFKFHAVGTGPWIMSKKFNPRATKHTFKKNQAYHSVFTKITHPAYNHMKGYLGKRLPFADELHIEIISESTSTWLKLKKGGLDIASYMGIEISANNLTPEKKPSKELQEKGIKALPSVPVSLRFLHFNHNVPFLQNVKVRQALVLATDFNRMDKVVYNNNARIPQGLILPGFKGHDPNYKAPYSNEYSVSKAKKILEEAGFSKGKEIPVFMLYIPSGRPIYQKIGTCIKEDWGKIGIHVNVISIPFNDLITKTKKIGSTTWHGCMFAWGLDMPDMINFFQLFYGKNVGGSNTSGYNNNKYNALYEEVATMEHSAKRTALYVKMNKIIGTNVPSIVIPIDQAYMFYNKRVKNIKPRNPMIYDTEKYLDVKDK